MIIATGVDTTDIERIRRLTADPEGRFALRVFTARERDLMADRQDPAPGYAGRFAAKEAVMKCLGTGWAEGVGFGDIEIGRLDSGAPTVVLSGEAAARAETLGIATIHVSISHGPRDAVAFAVAESASSI